MTNWQAWKATLRPRGTDLWPLEGSKLAQPNRRVMGLDIFENTYACMCDQLRTRTTHAPRTRRQALGSAGTLLRYNYVHVYVAGTSRR